MELRTNVILRQQNGRLLQEFFIKDLRELEQILNSENKTFTKEELSNIVNACKVIIPKPELNPNYNNDRYVSSISVRKLIDGNINYDVVYRDNIKGDAYKGTMIFKHQELLSLQ